MVQEAPPPITKLITLAEGMSVKDLADKLEMKVKDVLKKLHGSPHDADDQLDARRRDGADDRARLRRRSR